MGVGVFGLKNNMSTKVKKTILILGGNGFIGSNLAEFFVKKGNSVIVFGKKESDYKNLDSIFDKIKIIKGDFTDSETLEKIFNKNNIDIVINLVSSVIPATPFDEVVKNTEINSTIKLLDIMNKNNVKKIVFLSSGGAIYGMNGKKINKENSPTRPINFYGWLKLTLENYIQMCHRTQGIDYLILRVSNVYGERQNLKGCQGVVGITLGKLIRGEQIEVWGDGSVIRDYIYIKDLCEDLYFLIQKNRWNDIYNIGSGQGTSINEIMNIIKKVSKIDFKINYQKGRSVDVPVNILDVSKFASFKKNKLTPLSKGIKETYVWLKNNNHD